MKNDEAACTSGITAEVFKVSGDVGVGMVTDLINTIIKDGTIPDDWAKSVIVSVYKGRGDTL